MVGQGGLVAGRKNIHFPDDVQQNAGGGGGLGRETRMVLSDDGNIFVA